eukprot:TRINITY_DN42891_c0_g1_i2.p1 TRINITY_DN42891_c0_g1~~TRINITY_DN42891_c0_g1_i2.p1  ORF type:complete len:179 (+),score=32.70 TRINITY_DN42891_c0_g1_i2:84-620(+)
MLGRLAKHCGRQVSPLLLRQPGCSARFYAAAAAPLDAVNLDRYPLHQLHTADGQRFLEEQRRKLQAESLLVLPDFITSVGIQAIQQESRKLFDTPSLAFRSTEDHNIMLDENSSNEFSTLPVQQSSKWLVAADQMPSSSLLKSLYKSAEMVRFVSGILGTQVYHSADPMNSLHLNDYW